MRPTELLSPLLDAIVKEEGIGGPLILFQPDKVDNDFSGSRALTLRTNSTAMVLKPKRKWIREI